MSTPMVSGGADRVLFVLATLAEQAQPMTIASLSRRTGLASSTLYRQIALLKRWGYVFEREGAYAPGPLCLQLAHGFDQNSFLMLEAQPEIARLAAESGESVGLMAAVRNQVVCLDMVESQHPLRCSFAKGRGLPLSRGASAKSLLAFMPQPQQEMALRSLLADEPAGSQAELRSLESELSEIQATGYAVSDGEVDQGVWGVGVPVFQRPGVSVGSITLMAPSTRALTREEVLVSMAVATADRISSRLQSH